LPFWANFHAAMPPRSTADYDDVVVTHPVTSEAHFLPRSGVQIGVVDVSDVLDEVLGETIAAIEKIAFL